MDGTIVDTKACHYSSWKQMLESYGYPSDKAVYDENFGRNNRALLTLLLGFEPDANLMAQMVDEKEEMFRRSAVKETELVPGVKTWLSELVDDHIPQVVASSAPMENITSLLKNFNLGNYFCGIISGDQLPAKPEPDIFFEAAKLLDCSPERCLVIEDSLAGVKAAKNAGMPCIAVATTHAPSVLTLADLVVPDFLQPLSKCLSDLDLFK